MKEITVKNDRGTLVLTPEYITAIEGVLKATILMMREREPENADCWYVGGCKIVDFAAANGVTFHYGDRGCVYILDDSDISVIVFN